MSSSAAMVSREQTWVSSLIASFTDIICSAIFFGSSSSSRLNRATSSAAPLQDRVPPNGSVVIFPFFEDKISPEHLLWKMHQGYELHPKIPLTQDMKIAEIGTGTAINLNNMSCSIWSFDLAKQLPSSVQLHGFDVSNNQYPSPDLWPENVSLGLLDAFDEPPASLVGQYDVVHLRMWASNFRRNQVPQLIQRVKSILKPGGYIQWEDADLMHQNIKGSEAQAWEEKWVSGLPDMLQKGGFFILESDTDRFEQNESQLCTNTYLLALREILQGIKRQAVGDSLLSITELEVTLS
ncbi:hypothetical protein N7478_003555 [Penicillium angulare]|uniref:uncharacterized protein n=1 Tax=Penicillium angulare TaxID=116970 RepID=UPI002540345A|nr:uncharacterized protein N7478_003555 [Penicillium angulare]KAJ5287869.1 hypothetical protein N7478_003555 [Penicillium angulare]